MKGLVEFSFSGLKDVEGKGYRMDFWGVFRDERVVELRGIRE